MMPAISPAADCAAKRTKIVATLGPACDTEEVLQAMIRAGLNVVRINFSHQKDANALQRSLARVRAAADAVGVPVAILGDLRGPRIRVGEMTGGAITLATGAEVVVSPQAGILGTPERIGTTFPALAGDVHPGNTLLLDDGNLRLTVREVRADGEILCTVTRGGILSSNRGINLPGQRVSLPSLTEKDFADIDLAIAHGFDFLALSFVQSVEDVRALNAHLRGRGAPIPVIAKIEKKGALDDIAAI
ncbi:MAG: pyruvate kinase, partial [Verrucomicrobia bacterium]|nr:pyruvate kinase [Verrucomicrobiota bacterium]